MFAVILVGLFVLIAVVLFVIAKPMKSIGSAIAGGVLIVVSAFVLLFSSFYTQGVGEAKVVVNFDGTIAGENLNPGVGWKAPWQNFSEWDLFSQNLTYAGDNTGAPQYTGGVVTGAEVSSSVARGAQTNFDLSITYSVDPEAVKALYSEFKTQERFTKQIVEQKVLSVVRDIPTKYTPVEFRGEKRGEASDAMLTALDEALNKYGVDVSVVSLQNIRFTEEVENSIKLVEVAQQKEAEAQANLRATEVSAQAQVVEATATAEANRLLTQSLTPEVLQQKYIDALKKGTVYVVPAGSTPLITTSK